MYFQFTLELSKLPIQESHWGYQAWKLAPASPLGIDVVHPATRESVRRLDTNFFRARFDCLTPRERQYLRALADMGEAV
jgi:hypothetical protein